MKKMYMLIFILISGIYLFNSQTYAQKIEVNGTSVKTPKNISNALQFDGIEDYVSIPNGTGIFANLSAFSMCGWVYPTNANAFWPDLDGYFGIKDEGVCDFYIVQLNGTDLEVRIRTDQGQFDIPTAELPQIVLNEWQHFALVYTGSELQLYYNGVLNGSVAATGTIPYSDLEVTIGKLEYFETDFFLSGKVDEVTFWDKALTADEVLENECISGDPSAVPDLIAYYNFNETEGLVLPDYFGNYDGNLTGMTGDEWVESDVCQSGFDILFSVTDELSGNPLQNAAINLDGVIKNTDSNGEATFTNYDPGVYPYGITKSGYYESTGEVTVVDMDTLVEVALAPIVYYTITYVVTGDPGAMPVDSAIVNMSGILQYTDETGQTTFTGFLPGSYPYMVIKEGYFIVQDTAVVVDQDLTEDVSLLTTGIGINRESGTQIYPNPVLDKLCIALPEAFDGQTTINLMNFTGESVLTKQIRYKNPMELDVSQFPAGIYLLSIETDVFKDMQKVVIQ